MVVPLLLALTLALPTLDMGFVLDDWIQRGLITGTLTHTSPYDLFTFAPGDAERLAGSIQNGPYPWFTLPDLKMRFIRPLAVALAHFDIKVLGSPVAVHAHSVLWGVALAAVGVLLYRRLLPQLAFVASVFFVIDDAHAMPVAWWANRNSVLATVFAWLGVWAHLEWREHGRRRLLPLALVSWVLAFASAEAAVAALAYVVAYELVGRSGNLKDRALGLAPLGVLVVGYAVMRALTGAGAYGSGTYIDPTVSPVAFVVNAVPRGLAMLGSATFGVPADLWLAVPEARPLLIGLGVAAVVAWPLLWSRYGRLEGVEQRHLRWLWVGASLALIPGLATFPTGRQGIASSLGLAAVVAVIARAVWLERGRPWLRRGLLFVGAWSFVLQPLSTWLVLPRQLKTVSEAAHAAVAQMPGGARVVVLAASDFVVPIFGPSLLREQGRAPSISWNAISMARTAHEVRRLEERVLTVTTVGGRMLETVFEQNFRDEGHPLAVGHRVPLNGLTVTVEAVDAGRPTRVRVDFALPVDNYAFVWWDGQALVPLMLPEVGRARLLPQTPGLFELAMGVASRTSGVP